MTGVLSARMAARGIPGIRTCFEGKAGFYKVYFRGLYDRASLTTDLGKTFEGAGASFKPWPCCRYTNPYVDATLQIVRERDMHPADVKEIVVSYASDKTKSCCEPLDVRRRPQSPPEAKLSIPFTVAIAVARRKVRIADFSAESLADPVLLEIAQKVTSKYDPALTSTSKTMLPGIVEIRTRGDKIYSKRVDVIYGHPQKPMNWDDLALKFRDCVSYSSKPISKASVEKVIAQVMDLEDLRDITEIISLIA